MLKLQFFGHWMQRANSLEKTLILGKIEVKRRRGWQRLRWLDGLTDLTDMCLSNLWEIVKDREPDMLQSMELQRVGHALETEQQVKWKYFGNIEILLGRKVMTTLDSILKSRDITLPTKVHLVKAMVFPVVMYGCESWTVKKAECRRIVAFELWCWRRLLRVPWSARGLQGDPTSPF